MSATETPAVTVLRRPAASLVRWPDPMLSTPAQPVTKAELGEPATAWAAMLELVLDDLDKLGVTGAAIAAPQIGVAKRIFLWRSPDGEAVPFVNPTIIERAEHQLFDAEACLSMLGPIDKARNAFLSGIELQVPRPERIVMSAQDVGGGLLEVEAEGRVARCFCHEVDHLDGVVMLERVTRQQRRNAERLWAKLHGPLEAS